MAGPALGVQISGKGIKETTSDLDAFRKAARVAEQASLDLAKADTAKARAAVDALKANKNATKAQKDEADAALKAAKAKESGIRASIAASAANDKAAAASKRATQATDNLSKAANKNAGLISEMRKRFDDATGSANSMSAAAQRMGGRLGTLAAAASAAVGGLAAMAISTVNGAADIDRMARTANTSARDLQRLAVGAKGVGIDMQGMSDILKDVNDRIGDFNATGGGPMLDFFENIAPKVGITKDAFNGLSGAQGLQLYVDSLQKAGVSQAEMTFYMEAMASESTRLVPLLADGGKEMNRLADRAERLGGIMSDDAVKGLSAMQQALTDFATASGAIWNQIGAAVAPVITAIAQGFANAIGAAANFISRNAKTIEYAFQTVIGAAVLAATAATAYYATLLITKVVGAITAASGAAAAQAIAMGAVSTSSVLAATGVAGLTVAMRILAVAIAATGVGAIVVAAGLLVGQFIKLVGATGSFGGALSAMGDVARAVYSGMSTGGDAVMYSLGGAADYILASFLTAFSGIGKAWDVVANGIAATWNAVADTRFGETLGLGVLGESNVGGAMEGRADGLYARSAESFAAAGALFKEAGAGVAEAMEKLNAVTTTTTKNLGGGGGGVGGAAEKAAEQLTDMQKRVQELNKAAAAGRTPIEKYRASLAELETLKKNGLTDAAYSMELENINQAFADSVPLIGTVSSAFGDFMADGLRDFKGFLSSIGDGFKQTLAKMAADAAENKILIPMATAILGGGAGTAAAGGAASNAGTAASLLGSVDKFAGAFWGGAKAAGSAFMSGGASGLFSSIGTSLSGATSGLAGLGTALGAIAAPIAAVAAVVSFFSKKTKELDRGLRVTVDGVGALVEEFSTIETKRFWGLSKKTGTSYSAAGADTSTGIGMAVADLQGGIQAAANVLGFGADTFRDFAHTITVSTKDMTEDQALVAIQEAVAGLGDAYAALVPDLMDQINYGEGASAALGRLSASLTAVRDVSDLLGHSFTATGLAGGALASHLADAFGGIEAMGGAVETYFGAFYNEAERMEINTRRAADALAAVGVAMPKTRAEFRSMVEALDLTDAGAHKTYAALVSMAGVMDQILPSVVGLTAALAGLQGNVSTGLDASIAAANAAAKANADAASNWYKASGSIRDWIAKLRGTATSLTSPQDARAFNAAQYQMTLASAMAGDLKAAQDITGMADRLLSSVNATARTQAEAAFEEAKILSDLGKLAGVGDIEGARHDVISGLLEQQSGIMQQVLDFIGAGNALTADMITTLETQLSGLDDAIAAAEMINYAYLKDRLQVTVDVLADASVPDYLKALLSDAATGVTGYIDFITRSDLDPDMKWLALVGASEHIKTIEFLAENKMGKDLTKIAVDTIGQLQKSVDFVVGRKLDPQTAALAQMQLSSGTKVINLANGKTVSADTMALALMGDKSATKTINAIAGKVLTQDQMRVALLESGAVAKTVNFGVGKSISSEMLTLALMGDKSAIKTVNLAAGKTMNADQMRAALMGDTAATKTINLANGKTVSTDVMRAALMGDAASIKTVNLAAGKTLDKDTLRIALAGNSELSRVVNVTLGSKVNAEAKRLALGNVGAYAVSVQAAFAPNISKEVRRVVLTQQGDYAAMIRGGISEKMSDRSRRILLQQQGGYIANITGVLASNMSNATRKLLLEANTEAVRAVTIVAAFGQSLTADERAALSSAATSTNKTIRAIINTAGLSATGALFLAQIGAGSSEVQKTMAGKIALSALSKDQRLLLASITETVQKSVAFKATGSATADQMRLLGAVSATILRAVDFATKGWLTKDQRDILDTVGGSVQRLLNLSTTGALTADQHVMLAAAAGSVSRSLNLTTKGALTDDQRRVLLSTAGSVARALSLTTTGWLTGDQKTVLGATSAAIARSLALTTTGWLTADQRKVIDAKGAKIDRALALAVTGKLTADQSKILATTSAKLSREIVLGFDMSALTKGVQSRREALLDSKDKRLTSTVVAAYDMAALGAGVPSRREKLLDAKGLSFKSTLIGAADTKAFSWGSTALKLLDANNATITKTLAGRVDLSSLNDRQKSLLDAITGGAAGKLTLGGSFTFDPATGFKTWYETQTKTAITSPMTALRDAMGPLRTALVDLKAGIVAEGKRQATAAAEAAKIQKAQSALAAAALARDTAAAGVANAVAAVQAFDARTGGDLSLNGGAARLGVTASGRLDYRADAVSGGSASDIAQWRKQFWNAGGLEDQMFAADRAVKAADAKLAKAREAVIALGGVPSFAGGGGTGDGPRSGGVDGMGGFPAILHPQEVVVDRTQGGFSEITKELKRLIAIMEEFKSQSRQIDQATYDEVRKVANRVIDWNVNGVPPVRAN